MPQASGNGHACPTSGEFQAAARNAARFQGRDECSAAAPKVENRTGKLSRQRQNLWMKRGVRRTRAINVRTIENRLALESRTVIWLDERYVCLKLKCNVARNVERECARGLAVQ